MGHDARLRREICHILVAMSAGEASDQQGARLDELVRSDEQARALVVDALAQMSDLEWEVGQSTPVIESIKQGLADSTQPRRVSSTPPAIFKFGRKQSQRGLLPPWWRGAAAFAMGAAAAMFVMFRLGFQRGGEVFVVDRPPAAVQGPVVARLVSHTSFMIDAEAGRAIKAGEGIHAGRTVTLFEGVAEIEFDKSASVRLKGPAMLTIDPAGAPHLKYGRMIVTNQGHRRFTLHLPLASTAIDQNSYVGIDGHGDDVFVYVFEGHASVTPQNMPDAQQVVAGKALRVRRDARSAIAIASREADSKAFDFDLLMASDQITVSPEYVQTIKQAKPIAYWRFEVGGAAAVKNEMNDRHALSLEGEGVRIVRRDGGGVAEFVIRDKAACLTSQEPFDEVGDGDYSIEMWVKPSHLHWGTLASLVERAFDNQGEIDRHAMLVELQGANAPPEGRARAIRFLHRSPPDTEPTGTNCFSSAFYRAQLWQHIVAVKRGDQLGLYLNGELVASAVDATRLPKGLQLVVGQLFSFGSVRPFVGHIDELAIYGRALTVEEIRGHLERMRAATAPAAGRL